MSKSTRRTAKGKGKAKMSSSEKLVQEWDLDANREKHEKNASYLAIKKADDGGLTKGAARYISGASDAWKKAEEIGDNGEYIAYWPGARVAAPEPVLEEFMKKVVGLSKEDIDILFENEIYTYDTVYNEKSKLFNNDLADAFDEEVKKRKKFTEKAREQDSSSSPWDVVMMFANIKDAKAFKVTGETTKSGGSKTKTTESVEEAFRNKYNRAESENKYLLVSALKDNFQGVTSKTEDNISSKMIKVPGVNIVSTATNKGRDNFIRAVNAVFNDKDAKEAIDDFDSEVQKRKMGSAMSSRAGARRGASTGVARTARRGSGGGRRATRRDSVSEQDTPDISGSPRRTRAEPSRSPRRRTTRSSSTDGEDEQPQRSARRRRRRRERRNEDEAPASTTSVVEEEEEAPARRSRTSRDEEEAPARRSRTSRVVEEEGEASAASARSSRTSRDEEEEAALDEEDEEAPAASPRARRSRTSRVVAEEDDPSEDSSEEPSEEPPQEPPGEQEPPLRQRRRMR